MDGLELTKQIRNKDLKVEIIIISACDDQDVIFKSVDLCLSRYIVKPFRSEDLLDAISQSIIRRIRKFETYKLQEEMIFAQNLPVLKVNNIVSLKGKDYLLREKEHRLIEILISNHSHFTPKKELMARIWGNKEVSEQALYSTIKRLRKKIPNLQIKNEKAMGYKLDFLAD